MAIPKFFLECDIEGVLFGPWVQTQFYLSTMVFTKVPQKFERGQPHIYHDFEGFLFCPWVQTQIYLSAMVLTKVP